MHILSGLLGTVGMAGVLYALYILHQLSRKLGAVTKMPAHYRGYYLAAALGVLALLARILRISASGAGVQSELAWAADPWFSVLGFYLPLAVAMTICMAVAWRYWSWLLRQS